LGDSIWKVKVSGGRVINSIPKQWTIWTFLYKLIVYPPVKWTNTVFKYSPTNRGSEVKTSIVVPEKINGGV
jgi:hypothetical protein